MEEQFILRVPPSVAERIDRLLSENASSSEDRSLDLFFSEGRVEGVSKDLEYIFLMDSSNDITRTSKRPRRGQGPTLCLPIFKSNEKIVVKANSLDQPSNNGAQTLSSVIGTISRDGQLCPLVYDDWRSVPNGKKDYIWTMIQEYFILEDVSKSHVLRKVGILWRNWKHSLKRRCYDPFDNDEDRVKSRDPRVDPGQFRTLLRFWNDEQGKEIEPHIFGCLLEELSKELICELICSV